VTHEEWQAEINRVMAEIDLLNDRLEKLMTHSEWGVKPLKSVTVSWNPRGLNQ
jgi:hypothetical protein